MELLAALDAAHVPAGPINTLDEVFADPQVLARGLRRDLPDAEGNLVPTVASPIVMNGTRMVAPTPSPRLGQHDLETIRWL